MSSKSELKDGTIKSGVKPEKDKTQKRYTAEEIYKMLGGRRCTISKKSIFGRKK